MLTFRVDKDRRLDMSGIPVPLHDAIAFPANDSKGNPNKNPGYLTNSWIKYFQAQTDTFSTAPVTLGTPVQLTVQAASIGSTSFPVDLLSSGLYYVDFYARITRAATTSSSLTVSIGWTDGTISQGISGAAMTANVTTDVQTGRIMVEVDGATSITYSTTYASVGATAMQYKLSLVLTRVPL